MGKSFLLCLVEREIMDELLGWSEHFSSSELGKV